MLRAGFAALALAALASAAPISEPTKTVETRDSQSDPIIWFPGGGSPPPPTFTLLPPITGGLEPSTRKRQDTIILPPITGGLEPSDKKKRQDSIGIGGGGEDPVKAHITALELEYETLVHTFGAHPPKPVAKRIAAIEDELLTKYGIKIIQSPDGTTTTFVPGKRDVVGDDYVPGGPLFPDPSFPGGSMNPDPVVPGGPFKISD
ncbi:Serine/threonine protein kinase [Hypoxylon texense]